MFDTDGRRGAVEPGAMARPTSDTSPITFRASTAWLPALDALAAKLSRPGIELTRTDAVRAACARGLALILAEEGLPPIERHAAPPAAAPSKRTPKTKTPKR